MSNETNHTPESPNSSKSPGSIEFKPLTEGLGFHPFSNGLPYTPAKPRVSSNGTGAVAAGRPQFVYQPRMATPVATPVLEPQMTAPTLTPSVRLQPQAFTPRKFEVPQEGILAFRVLGFLVDTAIHFLLGFLALTLLVWKGPLDNEAIRSGALTVGVLFLCVLNWALIAAQEVVFKTSFGKRLFGLILRTESDREPSPIVLLLRAILFVPSTAFAGLGLLWAAFDEKRRCWHDLATATHWIRI